jgi:hypothetical protein
MSSTYCFLNRLENCYSFKYFRPKIFQFVLAVRVFLAKMPAKNIHQSRFFEIITKNYSRKDNDYKGYRDLLIFFCQKNIVSIVIY